MEAANNDREVILRGTVTQITPARGPHPHLKWVATLRIESVLSGEFSGKSIALSLHSPTKAGVVEGRRYEVRATPTASHEYAINSVEPVRES